MKYCTLIIALFAAASTQAQSNDELIRQTVNKMFTAMKEADSVMLADVFAPGAIMQTIVTDRNGSRMVGIVSVAIYGFDTKAGPIVWLREVAVLPEHQGEGYGHALVESALQYGIDHGAVRAFLLADDCNTSAIALYRKVGFVPSEDDVQIDLVYQP